jgi:hypothetical protein
MIQACVEDLLIRGLDDWIQAVEVASVSMDVGGAQSHGEVRDLSLRVIRKLLDEGFAEPGDVYEQEGFVPWQLAVDDAMQRIATTWPAGPEGPGLGEVCWLNLTRSGQAEAECLWSKRTKKED